MMSYSFHPGVVERGHIYFFYRPKVQHEHVYSTDDVKSLYVLPVPRPPRFSMYGDQPTGEEGADVEPAHETLDQREKHCRLLTIGKKRLPRAEGGHDVFWATVTAVGDDLHALERGFEGKTYETKTRGVRHEGQVRLAGRGVYAIVNKKGHVPSKNVTHLAYHLTHPSTPVQVKNPLADAPTCGPRVGLSADRRAQYPNAILDLVFERGSSGRHDYGLRFTACRSIELLEYEGAELLMIASRKGVAGSDARLGEHRGEALKEAGETESQEEAEDVFRELAVDKDTFPAEPLEGEWI